MASALQPHRNVVGCAQSTVFANMSKGAKYKAAWVEFTRSAGVTTAWYRGTPILSPEDGFTRAGFMAALQEKFGPHKAEVMDLVCSTLKEALRLPDGHRLVLNTYEPNARIGEPYPSFCYLVVPDRMHGQSTTRVKAHFRVLLNNPGGSVFVDAVEANPMAPFSATGLVAPDYESLALIMADAFNQTICACPSVEPAVQAKAHSQLAG